MVFLAFLFHFFAGQSTAPEVSVLQCGYNPDGVHQCVEIYNDGLDNCLYIFGDRADGEPINWDNGEC